LVAEHPGRSSVFWMDVSFDETLRRHGGRPDGTTVAWPRLPP
jgi:hypothetical protein